MGPVCLWPQCRWKTRRAPWGWNIWNPPKHKQEFHPDCACSMTTWSMHVFSWRTKLDTSVSLDISLFVSPDTVSFHDRETYQCEPVRVATPCCVDVRPMTHSGQTLQVWESGCHLNMKDRHRNSNAARSTQGSRRRWGAYDSAPGKATHWLSITGWQTNYALHRHILSNVVC